MLCTKSSSGLYCNLPRSMHAFLVRGPLSLAIGPPKWHRKAAQMDLLSASTALITMLCSKSVRERPVASGRDYLLALLFDPRVNLHAPLVRSPSPPDNGPPKWHCKAVQMHPELPPVSGEITCKLKGTKYHTKG